MSPLAPSSLPARSTAEPFGTLLGLAPGAVPVYSSDYASADAAQLPDRHAYRHYEGDIYTGYKWQCVEFARRYWLLTQGYVFDDIAMAYDIFRLRSVKVISDHTRLPLAAFTNGSRRHPQPGAMLIWSAGGEFETTGHVAIITDVFADKIYIAEQNLDHQRWPDGQHHSRELAAQIGEDGAYWIACSYEDGNILGWVMQTFDDTDAFCSPPAAGPLFALKLRAVPPAANRTSARHWLNPANRDEAAYLAANGERLAAAADLQQRYCVMSHSAEEELIRATNELHALFMHATDYVLEHPERLAQFNIPPALWPRLRQSWSNRRNQLITGRFDFCLTEAGLKLYEYNCDSASCHMETGKIQQRWAEHFGADEGHGGGEALAQQLIDAWRQADTQGTLHILLDEDAEETYHALYMQNCMRAAGIHAKLVQGLRSLKRDGAGAILDADGEPVRLVWKTWAWETALEQLRVELGETPTPQLPAAALQPKLGTPRLMEVLFHPDILIFEPLWTLIPSNKAILPLLWELFPEHDYLLESQFELTPRLAAAGFVRKPIAGHSGDNIAIFRDANTPLTQTLGRFDHQNHILQALAPLPKQEDWYVQLSSFSAGGTYAGACVRVDRSPIITHNSDLIALRVLDDKAFLRPAD